MAGQTLSYNPPYQQSQPGSVGYGGGGGYPVIGARNALDMRRMMQSGRVPDAQYPDGYLSAGIPNDRHQDKLLQNYGGPGARYDRPYTRGVHKGERLDRQAYQWPSWMNLTSGLERQAQGLRWAPRGTAADAPTMPGSNATPGTAQPYKAADLARFAPTWR